MTASIEEGSDADLRSREAGDHRLATEVVTQRPRSWYVVRDVNISEQQEKSKSRDGRDFTESEDMESSRRSTSKMQRVLTFGK